MLQLVRPEYLAMLHIHIAQRNLLPLLHIPHRMNRLPLNSLVPREARIRHTAMVEPRRVGEYRRPGAHLHAVGLEDGDDRGGRAGARIVLLLDALEFAARDVGVDLGGPGGEGLAVAAVQGVVEGLLGGCQGGEGRRDVFGEVVPDGYAEQWRVTEDSRSAGDVGGCDAAVALVWEGADLVERVV
jgi:hypothetical protein